MAKRKSMRHTVSRNTINVNNELILNHTQTKVIGTRHISTLRPTLPWGLPIGSTAMHFPEYLSLFPMFQWQPGQTKHLFKARLGVGREVGVPVYA